MTTETEQLEELDDASPILPMVWYHTKDRECPYNQPLMIFCVGEEEEDVFCAHGWRSKRAGGYIMFADQTAVDTELSPVAVLSFAVISLPDGQVVDFS